MLLPIGGVALLGRPTRNAVQELVIAAAGPAVNVVIIALLAPLLWLIGEPVTMPGSLMRPDGAVPSLAAAVHWLLGVNISLVHVQPAAGVPRWTVAASFVFLGLWLDWRVATRWAARTGQDGWRDGTVGALHRTRHARHHRHHGLLCGGVRRKRGTRTWHAVRAAHRRRLHAHTGVLADADRVETAVSHLLSSYQTDFAVMRGVTCSASSSGPTS